MPSRKLVAVACKLFPGMFPSERVFQVSLANGETYRGIAPRHFCWNALGQIVDFSELTNGTQGKVAAKVLEYLDADQVAVEVPDGEVLAVPTDLVAERPTDIKPPSPSRALEPSPNVPV
jgi:hypothetical protein